MLGGSSKNMSTITVTLDENRRKSTEDIVQQIRESIIDISGAVISVEASSTTSSMSSYTEKKAGTAMSGTGLSPCDMGT